MAKARIQNAPKELNENVEIKSPILEDGGVSKEAKTETGGDETHVNTPTIDDVKEIAEDYYSRSSGGILPENIALLNAKNEFEEENEFNANVVFNEGIDVLGSKVTLRSQDPSRFHEVFTDVDGVFCVKRYNNSSAGIYMGENSLAIQDRDIVPANGNATASTPRNLGASDNGKSWSKIYIACKSNANGANGLTCGWAPSQNSPITSYYGFDVWGSPRISGYNGAVDINGNLRQTGANFCIGVQSHPWKDVFLSGDVKDGSGNVKYEHANEYHLIEDVTLTSEVTQRKEFDFRSDGEDYVGAVVFIDLSSDSTGNVTPGFRDNTSAAPYIAIPYGADSSIRKHLVARCENRHGIYEAYTYALGADSSDYYSSAFFSGESSIASSKPIGMVSIATGGKFGVGTRFRLYLLKK